MNKTRVLGGSRPAKRVDEPAHGASSAKKRVTGPVIRSHLAPSARRATESIAIVGIGCRIPGGANSPQDLWKLLKSNADVIGDIPRDRWDFDGFYHPDPQRPGRFYIRRGGFIKDIDQFDANFFGISPREASQMDPQQRLLLEMAWEALEDAGRPAETLAGLNAGVFIGMSSSDFARLQMENPEAINAYTGIGTAASIAANRVSYFLDLHGPSMAIDTACSSALVAVHEACQSLRNGESSLCLAGGVNIILSPYTNVAFCKAGMLSPQNRCHSFDAAADGYVRAEGGGMLVLKPLSAAEADGDPIYAVIVASGANCDGRTSGIFLPSSKAQQGLLEETYARAGIAPAAITYVEAHGTGTPVGDPIECTAIGGFIAGSRQADKPLLVGSIKSNVGHLEAASGIAGLIKVALALQHCELPATIKLESPNPNIPFEDLRLKVVTENTPLPEQKRPHTMGVNSFGFGGTNAHVVLEEYRPGQTQAPVSEHRSAEAPLALPISARSETSLRHLAQAYAAILQKPDGPTLADLCHSAAFRRAHLEQRLVVFGADRAEVAEKLEAFAQGDAPEWLTHNRTLNRGAKLAFVFSGNGAQWCGMGQELFAREPLFRAMLERIDALMSAHTDWSLVQELFATEESSRLRRTEFAQPLLFAVQAGLLELLRARGIEAEAAVGHSVGEVSAAYAAGALSLEQAVRVICGRSRAQAPTAGSGKMAAVGVSAAEAEALIRGHVGINLASINSPTSVTLTGNETSLLALGREVEARQAFFRLLNLDYAFHSPAIDHVQEPLLAALEGLKPGACSLPFVSTVTGDYLAGTELGAGYWWSNVRKPVLFAQAIDRLMGEGFELFLEIGPHPVLGAYLAECARARGSEARPIATLKRHQPEQLAFYAALGHCYTSGARLDRQVFFPARGRFVPLPAYPWDRERHWPESVTRAADHPLLGYRENTVLPTWTNRMDGPEVDFLADHVLRDAIVFPTAAYVEMAVAAARRSFEAAAYELENFDIRRPLVLQEDRWPVLECSLSQEDGSFQIASRNRRGEGTWQVHVVGRLGAATKSSPPQEMSVQAIKSRLPLHIGKDWHYRALSQIGLRYGKAFRGVEAVWAGDGEVLGQVVLPRHLNTGATAYNLHPVLLDACFQAMGGLLIGTGEEMQRIAYLPAQIRRLRVYEFTRPLRYCHAKLTRRSERSLLVDLRLLDSAGHVVCEIESFRLQRADLAAEATVPLYGFQAQPRPHAALLAPQTAPRRLSPRLAPRVEKLCKELKRKAYYREFVPRIDQMCLAYIRRAFEDPGLAAMLQRAESLHAGSMNGLDRANGESASAGGSGLAPAILPHYQGLFRKYVALLDEAGALRKTAGRRALSKSQSLGDPCKLWRELFADSPASLAALLLWGRGGEQLSEILKGKVDPLSIFTLDTLEHFYESDPACRFYNRVLAETVKEIVRAWPPNRVLRILEIGAGTGAITSTILPSLPEDRTEYHFTDISEIFISRAQLRFADFPFVRCSALDIERDAAQQGFADASFDLAIAANVLHATADLKQVLARVNGLLTPQGRLLLLEVHEATRLNLTFALLKDWWKFRDHDLREDSPLLSPERWMSLLNDTGFRGTELFNDGACTPHPTQSVIVAHKGGKRAVAVPASVLARTWLVFSEAEQESLGEQFAQALLGLGHRVVTVCPGTQFKHLGNDSFALPPDDPRAYRRLCRSLASRGVSCDEFLHCWGVGIEPVVNGAGLMALQDRRCLSTILFLQGARQAAWTRMPRFWLITAGAVPHPGREDRLDPSQAPLWGLGRVIGNEDPDLICKLVDLCPGDEPGALKAQLLAELNDPDDEDEILLSAGARHVHRVRRVEADGQVGRSPSNRKSRQTAAFTLDFKSQGSLDSLFLRSIPPPKPGAGQVLIRIAATGLNFRDVMWAMRMLPEEALEGGFTGATLGLECSGEVASLGSGVKGLKVGDRVIAFASSCFSSHVLADPKNVAPIPAGLSFEEAATIPSVFFTAYYALHCLAQLREGERVLIHGAAGGVGLAALQIAQARGAEVFATAGSAEKRELLRMQGVDHVLSSRSLAFASEIMEITAGKGVDVVLNSLAGEAIHQNLNLLRPFGRFLEIGKRDLYLNSKLGLRPFRNNISYFAIDADQFMVERPQEANAIFRAMLSLFDQGILRPLPYRAFPVSRVAEAFRHMQQSRHIGKVIVNMEASDICPVREEQRTLKLEPDGTYLVTGGLGGFGLATAKWLVEKGARHLILMSRRGAATAEAKTAIAEMQALGVQVCAARADVSKADEIKAVLVQECSSSRPLRGVIHAAMVLNDRTLINTSPAQLHRVLSPKILGAWNLHHLTLDRPLDFFILYSSATTVVGNPGQANYVAACHYLEALARYRRSRNLPALAVSWGAIEDVGYLARHAKVKETAQRRIAVRAMHSRTALDTLEQLMLAGAAQAAAMTIGWSAALKMLPTGVRPKFSYMAREAGAEAGDAAHGDAFREVLLALAEGERLAAATQMVAELLGKILRMPAAKLDLTRPILEMGIDSLMAVELKMTIEKQFGVEVPTMEFMGGASVASVARRVLELAVIPANTVCEGPTRAAAEIADELAEQLDGISDEAIDLYLNRLVSKDASNVARTA